MIYKFLIANNAINFEPFLRGSVIHGSITSFTSIDNYCNNAQQWCAVNSITLSENGLCQLIINANLNSAACSFAKKENDITCKAPNLWTLLGMHEPMSFVFFRPWHCPLEYCDAKLKQYVLSNRKLKSNRISISRNDTCPFLL